MDQFYFGFLFQLAQKSKQSGLCGSRKYPYHPHGRDRIFQGEGGGGHHREIFPDGFRDA